MKINDAIFGAAFGILGFAVLVVAQTFPPMPGQDVGPSVFQSMIAAGLMICGTIMCANGLRARRAATAWFEVPDWFGSSRHLAAFAVLVAGILAYVWLSQAIGFLLLAPLLMFAWTFILGVRPVPAIVTAIAASLSVWFAFYKILGVPLPWGVLKSFAF